MRTPLLGFIFGLACSGFAGTYVLKSLSPSLPKNPHGGMIYWGASNSAAYGLHQGLYGASEFDGQYVNCTGQITTVWVWQRVQIEDPENPGQMIDDPLDEPPEYVISEE